ncbi:biotin--[acetyl-CoA-carboxylase] ligase [Lachnospiraceae bacterium ZAX-1]
MKTKILQILRNKKDYVSGQELCNLLGVSRTAVWKAINQLRESGYDIEAGKNRGYRMRNMLDILSKEELLSIRKTDWIGTEIHYYDEVDSTNNVAKRLAEEGKPHGTLVVAEIQSQGKGRRGRGWISPAGEGLWFTILLKPDINPSSAPMLTLVMAMAVIKAIQSITGIEPSIKWPNDIIIDGKKVCGILTEMSAQIDYVNHIVLGTGINIHNKIFPDEIKNSATSLDIELQRRMDKSASEREELQLPESANEREEPQLPESANEREEPQLLESASEREELQLSESEFTACKRAELLEAILEQFETYYASYCRTQDLTYIYEAYNEYLINKGKQVRISDYKTTFDAYAIGINKRGELLVDRDGTSMAISAGEVSVRGIYGYV